MHQQRQEIQGQRSSKRITDACNKFPQRDPGNWLFLRDFFQTKSGSCLLCIYDSRMTVRIACRNGQVLKKRACLWANETSLKLTNGFGEKNKCLIPIGDPSQSCLYMASRF